MTLPKIEKHQIYYVLFLFIFVLLALGGFYRAFDAQQAATVSIREKTYTVEIAKTEADQAKGLGGREMLADNTGMLFVFDHPDQYGFWMKDTLIPLDIIWVAADKSIVHIEKNVQPESYPTSFEPDEDALYVLEVAAGEAEKNFFADGDKVSISIAE